MGQICSKKGGTDRQTHTKGRCIFSRYLLVNFFKLQIYIVLYLSLLMVDLYAFCAYKYNILLFYANYTNYTY